MRPVYSQCPAAKHNWPKHRALITPCARADSNPEKEYQETINKAKALFMAAEKALEKEK